MGLSVNVKSSTKNRVDRVKFNNFVYSCHCPILKFACKKCYVRKCLNLHDKTRAWSDGYDIYLSHDIFFGREFLYQTQKSVPEA